jgi:hypothetical protein
MNSKKAKFYEINTLWDFLLGLRVVVSSAASTYFGRNLAGLIYLKSNKPKGSNQVQIEKSIVLGGM